MLRDSAHKLTPNKRRLNPKMRHNTTITRESHVINYHTFTTEPSAAPVLYTISQNGGIG